MTIYRFSGHFHFSSFRRVLRSSFVFWNSLKIRFHSGSGSGNGSDKKRRFAGCKLRFGELNFSINSEWKSSAVGFGCSFIMDNEFCCSAGNKSAGKIYFWLNKLHIIVILGHMDYGYIIYSYSPICVVDIGVFLIFMLANGVYFKLDVFGSQGTRERTDFTFGVGNSFNFEVDGVTDLYMTRLSCTRKSPIPYILNNAFRNLEFSTFKRVNSTVHLQIFRCCIELFIFFFSIRRVVTILFAILFQLLFCLKCDCLLSTLVYALNSIMAIYHDLWLCQVQSGYVISINTDIHFHTMMILNVERVNERTSERASL